MMNGHSDSVDLELPRFFFALPIASRLIDNDAPKHKAGLKGIERILLVDDDAKAIETIRQMLEPLGYRVTSAHGSMEALCVFRNDPNAFDIVLTDLAMPIMTGLFLASELIKVRPDIPVIILTGYISASSAREAKSIGISTVLTKPFSQVRLALAIRNAVDSVREH